MSHHRFRIFSLEEANRALRLVNQVTASTRRRMRELREEQEADPSAAEEVDAETRLVLDEWARVILEIGAQPKGIFTVDFRSPDPNVLWCWAPDEAQISHRHFTWESFKDRVSIDAADAGWPSLN
ncbi:MAG TPA: DUF2203 family protein [Acidobacteriota bacterium]|nr:DUF2203 family protein [Acidobacteriota bacterium]